MKLLDNFSDSSDPAWKVGLLKQLQEKRLNQNNGPDSWLFFKMPSDWLRNGEPKKEKFRLLDEIPSRGERTNSVKIYESLNPKLSRYLYIWRRNSYAMWRVPRPTSRRIPEVSRQSQLQQQPSQRLTPDLIRRLASINHETLQRISKAPSATWNQLIRLPFHAWDILQLIHPDDLARLARTSSREQTRIVLNGSVPQRVQPRRVALHRVPNDRGDYQSRPSRIPLPVWRLRRRTQCSQESPNGSAAPRQDDLGRIRSELPSPVEKNPPKFAPEDLVKHPHRRRQRAAQLYEPIARCACNAKNVMTYMGLKWWCEDMAVSPTKMKIETVQENMIQYRREEDEERVELGRGAFSTVYLGDLTRGGESSLVAIKAFREGVSSPDMIRMEARIMRVLEDTGFVPRLFGYSASSMSLVQECYGQGTTLEDLLSAAHVFTLPRETWISIAINLAVGLREFFNRGILHNDIRAENVLVDWSSDGYPVKYIDFGKATFKSGHVHLKNQTFHIRQNHHAPELSFSGGTSPASEIYSLGVLLDSIAQKGPLPEIRSIAEKCQKTDPVSRPHVDVVINSLRNLKQRLNK